MKQLLQDIRTGVLAVQQVPQPSVAPGEVLIANQASLVSAGTEKMVIDLAKKSLFGKARERPDHVRRVLEKVRNEGLLNTYRQVRQKLDEPMTMGYSSAGVVLACGRGVQEYKPGDRVASNGPHAEVVSVPRHLCARIPDGVPFESASFGVLGSIALHGVRMGKCALGETAFVIGLGLIGQLTVSLLHASGVRVFGFDPDTERCELARLMGADMASPNLQAAEVRAATAELGADAIVITASTKSNGPIELAADAVRHRGRIVLVGVVGLQLDRRAFYFKECDFVVSCSYGPGRYDANYERRGQDYPPAYVRWTEQRNIQAVLNLLGRGTLNVQPLISHRFTIADACQAYQLMEQGTKPFLGIVLNYPQIGELSNSSSVRLRTSPAPNGKVQCGVLGTGNFARMVMLPAIRNTSFFQVAKICSAKGVSAAHAGKKYGAPVVCSDEEEIYSDTSIDAIFALTRHDLHAQQVLRAIDAGKHIFVEKPLCITTEELTRIEMALVHAGDAAPIVMVGFNRRFAPATIAVRKHFAEVCSPLTISIRFNAGNIAADHWTQHEDEGGGRIIGEACHAIDLATSLSGSPPVRVFAESTEASAPGQVTDDQCFITMRHANGSVSSIAYIASGDRALPKERVEVFGGGRAAVIDDFRTVTTFHKGKSKHIKMAQQKGHADEITAFGTALRYGESSPISWTDLRATTLAAILAVQCLREGEPLTIT